MSHPPQASLSSSGRLDTARGTTARFDEGAGAPRTRTSDGRSSEERLSEEQAFERAAAQLRPSWATGQARQYLGAAPAGTPISGTTPLPLVVLDEAASIPSPVSPLGAPAEVARASTPASPATQSAAPSDSESTHDIALSDALTDASDAGESDLGPQPVFAASHSNFPAQPFDVGVTPSTQFRARHITGDTDKFSAIPGKRSLNVRLLAIGGAACLAVVGVWALASGGSDQPAGSATQHAPVPAPAAASAPAAVAPVVPANLPEGRELPASLLPSRSRAEDPRAVPSQVRTGSNPASKPALGKAAIKARAPVARPAAKLPAPKLPAAKLAGAKLPATKLPAAKLPLAKSNTPFRAVTKSAPVTKAGSASTALKSNAQPAVKAKPQAKAALKAPARGRSSDVVDPWGR
jgi:hypothetical protein